MNNDAPHKKPLIIAGVVFAALFLVLTIVTLFMQADREQTTADEVAGTETIDPVSGERIAEGSHQSQTGAGSPNSDRPTMLGFGTLLDYGLTAEQSYSVSEQITEFAKQSDPKITYLSFYKDSYGMELPDENGIAHMTFLMQAEKKTDYYVDVAYSGTDTAEVSIYKDDKKTLVFSK